MCAPASSLVNNNLHCFHHDDAGILPSCFRKNRLIQTVQESFVQVVEVRAEGEVFGDMTFGEQIRDP